MGASLGCATRLMTANRRAAIAEADREDARRGVPDLRPRDYDPDVPVCPHRLPGCRCDGTAHSIGGRLR